jgi:transcriptional regulator with XRE-family HTH domain
MQARHGGRYPVRGKRLMGSPRPKPERLAEKLLHIRISLGLSQTQMLRQLEMQERLHYGRISEYETGKREPTLMTILQYARVAGIHMEDIVEDDLDLPTKLPGNVRYQGIKRFSKPRPKR